MFYLAGFLSLRAPLPDTFSDYNKMTQIMSDPKANPAYEDEERTSSTATLKGAQPFCQSKLSFSSG